MEPKHGRKPNAGISNPADLTSIFTTHPLRNRPAAVTPRNATPLHLGSTFSTA